MTKPRLALFCENSSLRGVGKAYRSHGLVRFAWTAYVFLMLAYILSSVIWLCMDYTGYHTIIQTTVRYEKPDVFPAVTVCSHHPFSPVAPKLWNSGEVLSPGNYSNGLKSIIKEQILSKNYNDANNFFQQDQLAGYYQSLTLDDAKKVGLTKEELFVHCHMRSSDDRNIRSGSLHECGAKVSLWSNPKHFNCYIVEVPEKENQDVSSIMFVLSLKKRTHIFHQNTAFVKDIFEKAYGARIAIHEPGVTPTFNRGAFHVEPGKMVEVSFSTVRWLEADTPKDKCIDHRNSKGKPEMPAIKDLDLQFQYNRETCMLNHIADYVLRKCNCILGNYPRSLIPNATIPYCSHVEFNTTADRQWAMVQRFRCVNAIQISSLREQFHDACDNPCHTLEYDLHVTTTQWTPTESQIHWLLAVSDMFRQTSLNRSTDRVLHYLHGENLSSVVNVTDNDTGFAQYAFVVLSRDNFNTVERKEKLIVTFNGLLSRLGGICSLSLGLSFAFIVELFEFLFRLFKGDDADQVCVCGGRKKGAISNQDNHIDAGGVVQVAALKSNTDTELKQIPTNHSSRSDSLEQAEPFIITSSNGCDSNDY